MNSCRFCDAVLSNLILDLGMSPPSNRYLTRDSLVMPEVHYPLKVLMCDSCGLLQTLDFQKSNELFDDEYPYFSSMSNSWLAHTKRFCDEIIARQNLDANSFVVEIASNDGYLLKNFVALGFDCLGIEPTRAAAEVALSDGISTKIEFFNSSLARSLASKRLATLIIGNNVLAHVPNLNDFVEGVKILLEDDGIAVFEFPDANNLLKYRQFDTVYHEHFSYFSIKTVSKIFTAHSLRIYDVEQISTHGGSIRVYVCHDQARYNNSTRLYEALKLDRTALLFEPEYKATFQTDVQLLRDAFLEFLVSKRRERKVVVGYGAAAKGNTLLNYARVHRELISYIVDKAPLKVGKYSPGAHIPIVPVSRLVEDVPDYVVVFPWNLSAEILKENQLLVERGVSFVKFIPEFEEIT